METVGFRCPVGFINYPAHVRTSTGTAASKGGRGVVPPSTVLEPASMKESETQRQEFSGEQNHREAARILAHHAVRREREPTTSLLGELEHDLKHDRYVDQQQIEETTEALACAIEAVQVIAAVQEGTRPIPGYIPAGLRDRDGGDSTE